MVEFNKRKEHVGVEGQRVPCFTSGHCELLVKMDVTLDDREVTFMFTAH